MKKYRPIFMYINLSFPYKTPILGRWSIETDKKLIERKIILANLDYLFLKN